MTPQDQVMFNRSYLQNLDGMSARQYLQTVKGQLKNARDYKLRDTRIIGTGGTVTTGDYEFFVKPINAEESTLDGGATIARKTGDLTNLLEANKLIKGNILVVDSIECSVFVPAREFATITNGRVTSAAPAAAGTTAASNNLIALCRGSYLTVKLSGKDIRAEGQLWDFPPSKKLSGVMGAVDDDGFVQIGDGLAKPLREIIVLGEQTFFQVVLNFPVDLTIAQNLEIEVALCGLLFESVG
jgi:hypothetical protein